MFLSSKRHRVGDVSWADPREGAGWRVQPHPPTAVWHASSELPELTGSVQLPEPRLAGVWNQGDEHNCHSHIHPLVCRWQKGKGK